MCSTREKKNQKSNLFDVGKKRGKRLFGKQIMGDNCWYTCYEVFLSVDEYGGAEYTDEDAEYSENLLAM